MKLFALGVISLIFIASVSFAQGYGTSYISFQPSSSVINQRVSNSINVSYTVSIASGGTWGTNLIVQNQAFLSTYNISVNISKPYGDPEFGGIAKISANNAKPGIYNIIFVATGDDPSVKPANFSLTVQAPAAPTSLINNTANGNATAAKTNSSSTIAATSPTTVPYTNNPGQQTNIALYMAIIAVVVMVVVIVTALKYA